MHKNKELNADTPKNEFNRRIEEIRQSGTSKDGRHYTDSVDKVKHLKREGKHQGAVEELLEAINLSERESRKLDLELPPGITSK